MLKELSFCHEIIFSPLLAFLNGYFILSCPEAQKGNKVPLCWVQPLRKVRFMRNSINVLPVKGKIAFSIT